MRADPRASLTEADARLVAGDLAGAIAVLEDATRGFAHAGLLARLGDLRARHGRIDAALEALDAALALDPGLVPARVALARCRPATGPDDANLTAIRALLDRAGLPPSHRAALAYAAAKLHDDADEPVAAWARSLEARAVHAATQRPYDAGADRALRERALARHAGFARAAVGDESRQPVLIVGMPRSGTTLVERFIASHPAARGAGELRALTQADQAFAALRAGAADAVIAAAVREQAATFLATLRTRVGDATPERIATKLPSDYRRIGAFATMFPQAAIVVCRRHPLDVGISTFMQHFAEGDRSTTEPLAFAAAYRQHQLWLDAWRTRVPNPWIEVHYETLVADPATEVRRLIDGLGLAWDPRALEHQRDTTAVGTASAWQVRQPVYQRSVARWRRYATELEPLRQALLAQGVEVTE